MSSEASISPASSTVRLTEQQRAALDRGAVSVALSAGAGCGKTTVLAERFLQELDGPEARALRSVVALTFTEKAARELRQRIRARCREKIETGDEQDVRRWRTILRGLEAAPIGTFHEFCGRMLRLHAVESGIDPEFSVLDESISRALRDQAVRITLRAALSEQDLDLINLAVDYGLGQIDDTLRELVGSAALADLETWAGQDPGSILEHWRVVWEHSGRPALIRQAAHAVRRCRAALEPLDPASTKLRARRGEVLSLLEGVETGLCPDSHLIDIKEAARISDLRGKDVWPSDEVKELVKKRFESLRKAIDKIVHRLSWSERLTREEIANRQRLARLALKAAREYGRLKRDRHGLDFNDLQLRFIDLLRARPGILMDRREAAGSESSIFEFILVDEFQDTDRLQSEILERLGGSEFLAGRLFVVGDFKQSIYGFRGAEPAIFQEWRQTFPASGRRDLSENFRSVPGVIHFVNALFAECFEVKEAGAPVEGAGPILNRLGPMRDAADHGPAVEFLWAHDDGASKRAAAHELRAAEAARLARHIRRRLDNGWMIFDRKTKRQRRAGPGDVAFLFRAMTDVGPCEVALTEEGLDYHTIGGAAFYAQQEIHDLINVLSVVEDPLDEVALAGTLRSPFFGLSDDGLYWLATSFTGGLTVGLARLEEIADLPPHDRRQAIRARTLLDGWRALKDRVSIAALTSRILGDSGYEAALVCEFLGPRKLANTRKLVTLARDFDRQGGFLLADFVAQLRAHRDDPPREEQASTSDEEGTSVRLMSIHQSKGLEFPIVVVPDLNRSSVPRGRLIAIHPELGLVVRPPLAEPGDEDSEPADDSEGGSLGWEACRALSHEQDEQESLRLFYVAVTRARDALILSSGDSPGQEPRSVALRLLDERFDLSSGLCRATLPPDWPVPEVNVPVCDAVQTDESEYRVTPRADAPRRLSIDAIRDDISRFMSKPVLTASSGGPAFPPARLIDLDPLNGLSSRSRRLVRLIRAILADPRLYRGRPLPQIAARAAEMQVPAAQASLVREASRLLGPWLETNEFRRLRDLKPDAIKPGFAWMVSRQPGGRTPTVFRGSCDLLIRDPNAGWSPLVVCLGGAGSEAGPIRASCRLRLLLTGQSAEAAALGPIRSGWILEIDPRSGTGLSRQIRFEPGAIDEAVIAAIVRVDAFGERDV
jgi:ATP-dependent helicase/nuclease subunit A